MIIEHYSAPCYVISALCVKNMYGEDLNHNKKHYVYVLDAPYSGIGSLIGNAKTFKSVEDAGAWWMKHKDSLIEDINTQCDASTLKIRKRTERIVEEDVENITLEE